MIDRKTVIRYGASLVKELLRLAGTAIDTVTPTRAPRRRLGQHEKRASISPQAAVRLEAKHLARMSRRGGRFMASMGQHGRRRIPRHICECLRSRGLVPPAGGGRASLFRNWLTKAERRAQAA